MPRRADPTQRIRVFETAGEAAQAAARHIGESLRDAIAERGAAALALSGGTSPRPLFAALARAQLDWTRVDVFQVDERVAPAGSDARNLTSIERALLAEGPLSRKRLHAMPVDAADLDAAAARYALEIEALGAPLDVVHLGLGADGHTASLFAGDPAQDEADRTVATTGVHAGYRRMTLTLPAINATREIVWLVTGPQKAAVLAALVAGGGAFPASRVSRDASIVFTDAAAHPPPTGPE